MGVSAVLRMPFSVLRRLLHSVVSCLTSHSGRAHASLRRIGLPYKNVKVKYIWYRGKKRKPQARLKDGSLILQHFREWMCWTCERKLELPRPTTERSMKLAEKRGRGGVEIEDEVNVCPCRKCSADAREAPAHELPCSPAWAELKTVLYYCYGDPWCSD